LNKWFLKAEDEHVTHTSRHSNTLTTDVTETEKRTEEKAAVLCLNRLKKTAKSTRWLSHVNTNCAKPILVLPQETISTKIMVDLDFK